MEKKYISLYASSVNNKDKKELLGIYREYISLVNHFDYIQKHHHPKALATVMLDILGVNKSSPFPFILNNITPQERENYSSFINAVPVDDDKKYAYINILTTKSNASEESMYSIPNGYEVVTDVKSLPHSIERVNIAFPKGSYPEDLTFNINGKYILTYNKKTDTPLSDLLQVNGNNLFPKTLSTILSVITELPDDFHKLDAKLYEKANVEGNITELMSDYENVILSSLSNLTEKQDRIIKQLLYQREGLNYLAKAEKQGLITQELQFQDLLNIRHLLNHQFDTLEGFGRFMFGHNEQNKSIRKRNLESYNRLFNKTFAQRVNTYNEISTSLQPLLKELCPNLLIREAQESNTKFLQRVKNYQKEHPTQELFVELNQRNDKSKASLQKNIQKIIPTATIIDLIPQDDFNEFARKIQVFMERQKFLENFQLLESAVCTHCLHNGENLQIAEAWKSLQKQGLITEEEQKIWNKFKVLRNELTHEYYNEALINKMEENFISFLKHSMDLNSKLEALTPKIISQTKEGVITFWHPNKKVVEVDAKNKVVLRVTDEKGIIDVSKRVKPHLGQYVENLSNNIKITTKGTSVVYLKLNNAIEIDLKKRRITFPDNNKLFLLSDNQQHYLVTPNSKLITSKDLTILSYIQNQKSISFDKNETLSFPNGYNVEIDNNTKLKTIKFTNSGKKYTLILKNKQDASIDITLSDNTIISLQKDGKLKIKHNNIELNYTNRIAFADSYTPNIPPINQKTR